MVAINELHFPHEVFYAIFSTHFFFQSTSLDFRSILVLQQPTLFDHASNHFNSSKLIRLLDHSCSVMIADGIFMLHWFVWRSYAYGFKKKEIVRELIQVQYLSHHKNVCIHKFQRIMHREMLVRATAELWKSTRNIIIHSNSTLSESAT